MKDFIKYIGIFFIRTIVRFFYIVPVKADRVIISCYLGTQYAGSPKVISEYIREWGKGKYEIIWAFKNKDDFAFLKDCGIKTVGYYSMKRLFLEATAKYCIDNAAGCFGWFPSRKGQYHIDTWHEADAIKQTVFWKREENLPLSVYYFISMKQPTWYPAVLFFPGKL